MKKILNTTLSLLMVMLLTLNFTNVQAVSTVTSDDDWISQALSDYEPLQSLINEYPETVLIQNDTEYILNETKKDKDGNILETNRKNFSSLLSMQKYEKKLKEGKNVKELSDGTVIIFSIGDGETKYSTSYSKIKVGLSLYKYSSEKFFVANVYEWLTTPDVNWYYDHKAVVGLSLGSQLSMDGPSTYGGRVTLTNYLGETFMRNNLNGGLTIQATNAEGIGYSINENAQHIGLISGIEGVLSCKATQTNPSDTACSAFAEYDYVSATLGLNNFSVSFPGGISFSSATTKTRYTYQNTLDLR